MPDETLYPNVWGRGGALFAFSGMDGKTDIDSQLVCALYDDNLSRGLRLYSKTPAFLGIEFRETDQVTYEDEVVGDDVIIFTAITCNSTAKCEFVAIDNTTIAIRISAIHVEVPSKVSVSLKMSNTKVLFFKETLIRMSGDESVSLEAVKGNVSISEEGMEFTLNDGSDHSFLFNYQIP